MKKKNAQNYPEEVQKLIKREETVEYKIVVDEVKTLSPQLTELNVRLKDKDIFRNSGLCGIKENGISLHVSLKSKQRALFILNSLIKAFLVRGFKFGVGEYYNHSQYNDKDRDFTIIEINKIQIRLKLREKQSRKIIKNLNDIEDEDLRKSYQYGFKPGASLLIPNGKLYFSVDAYVFNSCTLRWEDEDKLPIENQLNKLIQDLIIISEEIRLRDLHFEEQRKQEQIQNEIKRQKELEVKEFQKRMEFIKELGLNSLIYEQVKKLKTNISHQTEEHIELLEWIDEYIITQDPMRFASKKKH